MEAESNFQAFLAEYKSGMTKATSTVFKKWEDIVKEWEDKLKKVDWSLATAQRELSDEITKDLKDEKQAFHLVVADALKSYVSELPQLTTYITKLQDTLTQSTQTQTQLTTYVSELQDTLKLSTQALITTQTQLNEAVQELQRLTSGREHSNSDNSNNTSADAHIDSNSKTPSTDTMNNTNNKDCIETTTNSTGLSDAETATMTNTALAQLAQPPTRYAFTHQAWSGVPRGPPINTSPTPTASDPLAPTNDTAPNTTPQGYSMPFPSHNGDGKEDNPYWREGDTPQYSRRDHYSSDGPVPQYSRRDNYYPDGPQYTRRDQYSSRYHSDTPRSHHEHERSSYPPQYSAMAERDKHKLSIPAQNWLTGGEVMGDFVHGVGELSPVTLRLLGVPEDAQLPIVNTHLRLRDSTPYTTGAFKFTKWPSLDVLQPVPFVECYSLLGSSLLMFHIALMPFNGIQLNYEEHGLCIPGLGYAAYTQQSQALWSILNTLLPATRSDIKTHITVASWIAGGEDLVQATVSS